MALSLRSSVCAPAHTAIAALPRSTASASRVALADGARSRPRHRPISLDATPGLSRDGSGAVQARSVRARARRVEGAGEGGEEVLDEDVRVGLNEVSNEAVRAMLSEDIQAVGAMKRKVDEAGEYLVAEGHMDAARFMLVVKGMLEHTLVPEVDDLQGPFRTAYDKMASVLDDSGWMLAPPGQEGGPDMVDDELLPPVLRSPYV
ncbi:hypothetical protein CLOM_g9270 [Closterium sp. NIES-68]|nr:hypothetical protein CLOM_g9270 [Closterium sp. NIES-68]GJP58827.1 hypothetical protein CLOP_g3937 [Closterium sp. NIES-67]